METEASEEKKKEKEENPNTTKGRKLAEKQAVEAQEDIVFEEMDHERLENVPTY